MIKWLQYNAEGIVREISFMGQLITGKYEITSIKYQYKHAPIPGGGYVTGFLFHEKEANILYARTDIGGVYRYDFENACWKSLMDHVTLKDLSESFPTAIGLDDNHPSYLYIACGCGNQENGLFCISKDYGETFTYVTLPCKVHGNNPGRGTGTRLVVDPNNDKIIYFASQSGGLLVSKDQGMTFQTISIEDKLVGRKNELNLSFVFVDPRSKLGDCSQTIVIGTAGIENRSSDSMRGHSLYVSYDAGSTFTELIQPESIVHDNLKMSGHVAQRYAFDGTYLYVTISCTGENSYIIFEGYSCDSGDSYDGKVLRYSFNEEVKIIGYKDITPIIEVSEAKELNIGTQGEEVSAPIYNFGFSGISSCATNKGQLMCTTICRKEGDLVLISEDYGESFRPHLCGLTIGNLEFHTSYMKPEYNGGHSILHWCSDIKINPFNRNQALINSGTGIFMTEDAMEKVSHWSDCCVGLEETVHLNVYSPPSGEVQVIDILGDLGGFAFRDLMKPCNNSFDDENGNRYITCINADYSDTNPNYVVVTPRGNWTWKTTGGLILSKDNCKTFTHLELPYGISTYLDGLLARIATPNVNSGWVALSADCSTIVWTVADHLSLPVTALIYSKDEGKTFHPCRVYNKQKELLSDITIKVFADRVNSELFYGFSTDSKIYISTDGGVNYIEREIILNHPELTLPKMDMSLIDSQNHIEIRGEAGKEGVFWLAMNVGGLWKMTYQVEEDTLTFNRITNEFDVAYCVGLGVKENADYMKDGKVLYIAGILDGTYGFYCSVDEGEHFVRINNDRQMYGEIKSIDGDSRVFGRVYIATGSRGLLYGEPVTE